MSLPSDKNGGDKMCSHLENNILNGKNNDDKINLTNESEEIFYNLTNDYAFKKIFTKKNNLKYLLNKFFNLKPKKIIVKNNELLKQYCESKAGIVDIFLELDNENVILELQNVNEYNIEERALFYSSCVIANYSLNKGQNYKDLKPLKILVILNYNYQDNNLEIANIIKNNKILTNKLEFKFFDLTKANKNEEIIKLCNIEKFDQIENFEIKLDIKNKDLLLDVASTLKIFNENKEDRKNMEDIARMMLEEKCYYENAYVVGCSEGKEEGRKEGIKEGKIEGENKTKILIAQNLLKQNVDINIIANATNLTKEKILSLKK